MRTSRKRWKPCEFCPLTKHSFYCNIEMKEKDNERTSSLRKLPSALLHHCRSVSPSSSSGCPPLDTLNWIPVRCVASPWVSFLRVTEHAASVHKCVYIFVCVCVGGTKQLFLQRLPRQNHTHTHKENIFSHTSYTSLIHALKRLRLLQAEGRKPISMGLGTAV